MQQHCFASAATLGSYPDPPAAKLRLSSLRASVRGRWTPPRTQASAPPGCWTPLAWLVSEALVVPFPSKGTEQERVLPSLPAAVVPLAASIRSITAPALMLPALCCGDGLDHCGDWDGRFCLTGLVCLWSRIKMGWLCCVGTGAYAGCAQEGLRGLSQGVQSRWLSRVSSTAASSRTLPFILLLLSGCWEDAEQTNTGTMLSRNRALPPRAPRSGLRAPQKHSVLNRAVEPKW